MRYSWMHLLFHACSLVIFPCFIIVQLSAQTPVVTAFTPTSGPIGTNVTITGTNFSPVAANNIVFFGAVRAVVSAATTTSLTVIVPAGATYQPITVTTNSLSGYSAKPFIVTFPGNATGFIPNSFAATVDYTIGSSPRSIVTGDLDGDGKPDMAMANYRSSTVSMLRNTSTGGVISFAAKVDYATGSFPYSMAIGDLDGDGKPDMAVANYSSSTVSVFKNMSTSGTVSFTAKVDYITGSNPQSVSIGDLDGDGKPDLVVTNSSTFSVLRNTSTGSVISFAAKVDYTMGTDPTSVAIGDLDGDGKSDLAVASYNSNIVSVFKNLSTSGTVSFTANVDYATGNSPTSVSTGDLDGDGKPDLAVTGANSNAVSVLRNTGTSGTISFAAKVDYATGSNPYSVSISDLNGDGKPDLAVANAYSNTVSVLRNTGTSGTVSFAANVDYATGNSPYSVAAGDLDGDGKPDLAVTNYVSNTVSVLKNQIGAPGITSFSPANAAIGTTVTITGSNFTGATVVRLGGVAATSYSVVSDNVITAVVGAVASGDVIVTTPGGTAVLGGFYNGAIITSFLPASGPVGTTVTISGSGFSPTAASNIVYFGAVKAMVSAATTTSLSVTTPVGASYQPITVTTSGLTAYSGNPFIVTFPGVAEFTATSFAAKADYATGTNSQGSVSMGDLDGDGRPDMLVANSGVNYISIFRNTGSSGAISFAARADYATGSASGSNPNNIALGDLDGDGKLDLAVSNNSSGSNSITVFRNTSSGGAISFATKVDIPAEGVFKVAIGDVDGDGKPDLVKINASLNTVSVLRNTGSSGTLSFAAKVDYATGVFPVNIMLGDLDGDGKPDLVVANSSSGSFSILRNTSTKGMVSFDPKIDYTNGSARDVSIGDFDGDGKPDIAIASVTFNVVSIFRNTSTSGTISFAARLNFLTGNNPTSVSTGDLDGDGKVDLVAANQGANTVSVLKNASTIGNLSFATNLDYTTGIYPLSAVIGDLDGDGKPDFVVANTSSPSTVSVFRNQILLVTATISTGNIINTNVCAGNSIDVPFTTSANLNSNNVFTAQLSDNTGSFTNPVIIGTLAGSSSGTIQATIPSNTSTGSNYLVRVVSSSPIVTGSANANSITINQSPASGFTVSGSLINCAGQQTYTVTGVSGTGIHYNWVLSGGGTLDTTTSNAKVNWTTSGTYTLSLSLSNTCGTSQQKILQIRVFAAVPSIIPQVTLTGRSLAATNATTEQVSAYQWYKEGVIINGATAASYNAALDGTYTVRFTNTCGMGPESAPVIVSTKKDQTITFNQIPDFIYRDTSFVLKATASSGLRVSYSVVSGAATVKSDTIFITGAGLVRVRASQQGNDTLNPATADMSFTVNKATATITLSNLNRVYDGSAKIPNSVTNPPGLQVSYLFNNASAAPVNAGNYYVAASINSPNYTGGASDTLRIAKADQQIRLAPIPDKEYGTPPFNVQATSSSGLTVIVSIQANPVNCASLSGSMITVTGIGTVIINASLPGNINYNAAPGVADTFNITIANQQIILAPIPDVTIDSSSVRINATINSGLPLSYSIVTSPSTGIASLLNNVITILGDTGTVTVKVSQAGNQFYNAAEASRTFKILGRAQLITFSPIPNKTFGDAPFTLNATASSGLPVKFTIVSGAAFLSGNLLTVSGAGTITVEASQPGTSSIRAATLRNTFSVAKALQTVSIDTITDKTYGDPPIAFNAHATSGLAVNAGIQSGYATISGNTIVITGAGTIVVSGSQNGNQNYLPATAQRTFCVSARKPQKIYGFAQACIGTQLYSIDTIAGATYTWTVSGGGTLLSNSGGKINVSWTSTGTYQLTVKAINSCNPAASDTTSLTIEVKSLPVPAEATNLFPVSGTVVAIFPFSLSWQSTGISQVYDLYIWPQGSAQPATPYTADRQTLAVVIPYGAALPGFAPGVKYNWKVVTKNACQQSGGVTGSFTISPQPNLVLKSVQFPDTTFSGKMIDVTVNVLNNGGASTRNTHWTDAVYLSRDTVLDNRFDRYIGGAGNLSSLDPGQQYANTIHCTLPKDLFGDYHLIVITNVYNSLTEVTIADDTVIRPIQINLTPAPDLQVTVIATPADAFSAQLIPVTYTVKNKGAITSNTDTAWVDYLYVSADPVFNRATAVKIGEKRLIYKGSNYLFPDSSYTATLSVQLPGKFYGTAYIFVETDAKDSVYEGSFENNNINRNDSIQVFLTPPPDFVISDFQSQASISSQEIISTRYTVKNIGATAPLGQEHKWVDGMYISKDSIFNIKKAARLDYTVPYTRIILIECPRLYGEGGSGGSGGGGSSPAVFINPTYGGFGGSSLQGYCNIQTSLNIKYYTDTIFYPSGDTTYYITKPCIDKEYFPYMAPDETYSNSISAVIPDTLEGTYYLHVYTDFSNTVFEYQQENNNTKANKLQIVNPDLVVSTVNVTDSTSSGLSIPLSWIIKNQGHGKVIAKSRKDLIWLSASPVYNPANMIRLDSLSYCSAIDSGASTTLQKTVRIPDGLSGNYYLFIETDRDKAIYEGSGETNNYLARPIKVNLTPWPDLKMNAVQTSKDSVDLDEDFILSYNVSNIGTAPIAGRTWNDIVYISRTPVLDTLHETYQLAKIFRAQSLDTNASYTVKQPVHLDGNVLRAVRADSVYYLYVLADGNRDIYEHASDSNNLGRSNKLFLKNVDLAVTAVNGSSNVMSGQNANVSWQVLNKGGKSGVFFNFWSDGVYVSTDTILDASDVLATAQHITGPILANGTYTQNVSYKVPDGFSGNYYLLVSADLVDSTKDINRRNNINTIRNPDGSPRPISITLTPSPDLVVDAFNAPSIGYIGQPVTVKWQVRNVGEGSTLTGGWKESIYLTTVPNPHLNNPYEVTLLGTYTRTGNLSRDSAYADSLRVFLPTGSLSGNYYIYFAADNYPSQVYEQNAENNNSALSQIFVIRPEPSDLIVTDITTPLQALAGDTVTVSWKVKNTGINPAEGYFTQGVYLSADTAWSIDDALVNNPDTMIYISPSDEKYFSKKIRAINAKEGNYYVIVKTDLTNNIVETNDNNNTGISAGSLSISILNLPLNISTSHPLFSKTELYYKLVVPDSLDGETFRISLRSPVTFTPNELYIRSGDLPSRSSFDYGYSNANNGNQDIVIPTASKGTYYILVYNSSDTIQRAVSLLAQQINFSITGVHTNEGGNTGLVTVKIEGAKFEQGMQVSLQSSSLGTIMANQVQYVNSTTVFATFNLAGKAIGQYDVSVQKAGGSTTSLVNGFSILKGSGGGLQGGSTTTGGFYCSIKNIGVNGLVGFDVQSPAQVRYEQYFRTDINFGNSGNVDVPLPARLLISVNGAPISLTQDGLAEGKTELYLEFKEVNGPNGVLRPGATGSITIYTKGTFIGNQTYRLIE